MMSEILLPSLELILEESNLEDARQQIPFSYSLTNIAISSTQMFSAASLNSSIFLL